MNTGVRRPFTAALLLAASLILPAMPVYCQDISKYYTVMHPDEFDIDWTAFYEQANARTAEVRAKLPHHLDRAYGPHPKQRLDLYLPPGGRTGAPVFLFLHGGGFKEGDRAQYGFIAAPFAAHGIITAVASYRLASEGFHYPAQADDAKDALAWLHEHVGEFGGDRQHLYVGGHSAGAILAAGLGLKRDWLSQRGIPNEVLRGIVPVSGVYDLTGPKRPGYIDAYARTPEAREEASPLRRLGDTAPAAVVAVGSLEGSIVDDANDFVSATGAHGMNIRLVRLEGHDHSQTALALADDSSSLFRAVLDMIGQPH